MSPRDMINHKRTLRVSFFFNHPLLKSRENGEIWKLLVHTTQEFFEYIIGLQNLVLNVCSYLKC